MSNSNSSSKGRILVVANRLPIKAKREADGAWSFETSPSGLVSALQGVKGREIIYIGWAGESIPDQVDQKIVKQQLAEMNSIPAFIDKKTMDAYYNRYSNGILWPLLHDSPFSSILSNEEIPRYSYLFESYKRANMMFADAVLDEYKKDDIVWCHDYHLFCLPKLLKEKIQTIKVMWFLHTSFPSLGTIIELPCISEILSSVLAADVLGFHTSSDKENFVSASTSICEPEDVKNNGKFVKLNEFPIGIDANKFIQALKRQDVQSKAAEYREYFGDRKVIVSVDRQDFAKGLKEKLLAFKRFLEENNDWLTKVILVQIAVPTRQDVRKYKEYTEDLHVIIGSFEGWRDKSSGVNPLLYQECSIPFLELCALYSVADVAFITSWRDGMNLVSHEFVACQASKKGVLMLSKYAGASNYLSGAMVVNPPDRKKTAANIKVALEMSEDERERRHTLNFNHVTTHTAQVWAESCLSAMDDSGSCEKDIKKREKRKRRRGIFDNQL